MICCFSVFFSYIALLVFFVCPSFSDNRLIIVNVVDLFSCTVTVILFLSVHNACFALQCLSVHMSFYLFFFLLPCLVNKDIYIYYTLHIHRLYRPTIHYNITFIHRTAPHHNYTIYILRYITNILISCIIALYVLEIDPRGIGPAYVYAKHAHFLAYVFTTRETV